KDVIYARRNGLGWTRETLPLNHNDKYSPSLKVDRDLHPHIVYQEDANGTNRIRYVHWDGTKWQLENVATGEMPSLALDSQNRPHIAFREGMNVIHAYLDNTTWTFQTVATYP